MKSNFHNDSGTGYIRPMRENDASRVAEILIFAKRVAYRPIFRNDYVSFQEMNVLDLALSYRENSNGWNKGMIARILDDNRYWNQNGFPSIIAEETARKVIQQKQEKSIPKSQLNFLKGKVICSGCGAALHRDSRSLPKVFWNCKDCGASFGPFTDAGFYQIILEKFQSLYQNPESIETEQIPDNSLPMKVVRLTNEIDRSLDEREIDPERVLSLIFECAAERYNYYQISGSEPETMKIRELLENLDGDKFNPRLFSQIVEQVIPQPDGSVKFRLVN